MKKLLILLIALGVLLGVFSKEVTLMAEAYLGQTTTHTVQKGESLSEIAYQYYGNAYLWRELSLVNMAPDPDLILPGEEITIPSRDVIYRLNKAKTISTVKDLVVVDETVANRSPQNDRDSHLTMEEPAEQPALQEDEFTSDENTPITLEPVEETEAGAEEAGFPWIWLIAAVLLIGGLIGLAFYRRRKQTEIKFEDKPETKPVLRKDSELEQKWDWSDITKSEEVESDNGKNRNKKRNRNHKEKEPIELG